MPDRYAACGREVDRAAGETRQRVGAASGSGVRSGRCRRWRNRAVDTAYRDAPGKGEVDRAAGETPQPVGATSGAAGRSDAIGVGRGAPEAPTRRSGRLRARSGVALVRSRNRPIRGTPPGGFEVGVKSVGSPAHERPRSPTWWTSTPRANARSRRARDREAFRASSGVTWGSDVGDLGRGAARSSVRRSGRRRARARSGVSDASPRTSRSFERHQAAIRRGRCRRWRNRVVDAAYRDAPGEGEAGRAGGEPLQPVGAASRAAGRSDAIDVGRGAARSSVPRSGRHPADTRSAVPRVTSCSRPNRRTPLGEIGGRREGGGSGSEARGSSMRRVGTNGAKTGSAVTRPRPWRRPDRRAPRLGDPRSPLPHGSGVPATSVRRPDARWSAPAGSATHARCP
ncbi:MAG: hypothetical protein KatS3mg117_1282 [Geminicoccaceae bacterium]|nr:MAG: hypothetical protein KatS3mg117_1282 [Geminicoccaceae bacterium]